MAMYKIKDYLKYIGFILLVLGFINLFFMKSLYGVCKYQYVACDSLSSYVNGEFIIVAGLGGFLSLVVSAILFFGFSRVIDLLEEIRDKK